MSAENDEKIKKPSRRDFLGYLAMSPALIYAGQLVDVDQPHVIRSAEQIFAGLPPLPPGKERRIKPRSVSGPVPPPGLKHWLQAGFNARIDPDTLYELRQLGVDGVRIDVQLVNSPTDVAVMAEDVLQFQMTPLVIVTDAWQIAALPPGAQVEVRNEPDIGTSEQLPVNKYAAIASRCIKAAHEREEEIKDHIPVWIGAVSNLNVRGLLYMKELFSDKYRMPADVGASIHRYPNGGKNESFYVPHEGFRSREQEVEVLKRIIGPNRPYGISELGYSTAANKWGKRWSDDEVAENLRMEFNFWAAHEADFCTVYQLMDGPEDTGLDKFGIRRVDGTWKPSAYIFR